MNKAQVEAGVRMLRELQTLHPFDAEKSLRIIAEIRAWIPEDDRPSEPLLVPIEERLDFSPMTVEEFEKMTVAEAVETLLAELHYAYGCRLIRCVKEYWAIQDDPEQLAELKEQIAALHHEYQEFFGKPVPPNPNRTKEDAGA
jgi:hypothetical protein